MFNKPIGNPANKNYFTGSAIPSPIKPPLPIKPTQQPRVKPTQIFPKATATPNPTAIAPTAAAMPTETHRRVDLPTPAPGIGPTPNAIQLKNNAAIPQPRRAAPYVPIPVPKPSVSMDEFISSQRARMEDQFDKPNAEVMSAKYPQYRNSNADNTAWNALKHSGTAEQMATKHGFLKTFLGGLAHEGFGMARKYYDPRMWGQNPAGQPFGFQEDVRRSIMDMRNNTIGAAIGSTNLTQEQKTAVQDWMLRNGYLQVLKGPQYPGPDGNLAKLRRGGIR